MLVHVVAGARPNFVKTIPVVRALRDADICDTVFIDTAQHADRVMGPEPLAALFRTAPDQRLSISADNAQDAFPEIFTTYGAVLDATPPDAVIVPGDVHASVAAALATAQRGIPVVHLEAGLRCGDMQLPEEINRRCIDAVASLFWTHSEEADIALTSEGVPEDRIACVGNTMIDTLTAALPDAQTRCFAKTLGLNPRAYALVTLHRAGLVDDIGRLTDTMTCLEAVSRQHPVVLVAHPRTRAMLERLGWHNPGPRDSALQIIEALPYPDFLSLLDGCGVVVTDSGGVQEESSYLGIPCLTLRESTERPVTTRLGSNRLVNTKTLMHHVQQAFAGEARRKIEIPHWDGQAADRCVTSLNQYFNRTN